MICITCKQNEGKLKALPALQTLPKQNAEQLLLLLIVIERAVGLYTTQSAVIDSKVINAHDTEHQSWLTGISCICSRRTGMCNAMQLPQNTNTHT